METDKGIFRTVIKEKHSLPYQHATYMEIFREKWFSDLTKAMFKYYSTKKTDTST